MTEKKTEALKLALKRAFNLGQTYWQQADSEYTSQWKKADVTLASFNQLVEDTIREALAEQPAHPSKPLSNLTEDNIPAFPWVSQSAQRKPLTDEAIVTVAKFIDIEFKDEGYEQQLDDILTFARAIEAAHGIKE